MRLPHLCDCAILSRCILSWILWLSERALFKSCLTDFTIKTSHSAWMLPNHLQQGSLNSAQWSQVYWAFSHFCTHAVRISFVKTPLYFCLSLSNRSSWRTYRVALSMLMMEASSFRGGFRSNTHTIDGTETGWAACSCVDRINPSLANYW